MKTQIKLLFSMLGFILSISNLSAQCFSTGLAGPLRTEIQGQNGNPYMVLIQEPATLPCNHTGIPLTGVGVNQISPNYMLDILCSSSTNQDVNISSSDNTVGYRIGGNQMLYTGGDPTSIFAGGQIAVPGAYGLSYGNNTCIGNSTYASNTGAYSNTFAGAWAGTNIINGHKNTPVPAKLYFVG